MSGGSSLNDRQHVLSVPPLAHFLPPERHRGLLAGTSNAVGSQGEPMSFQWFATPVMKTSCPGKSPENLKDSPPTNSYLPAAAADKSTVSQSPHHVRGGSWQECSRLSGELLLPKPMPSGALSLASEVACSMSNRRIATAFSEAPASGNFVAQVAPHGSSQGGAKSSGETRSPVPRSAATISVGAQPAFSNPLGSQDISHPILPTKATGILRGSPLPCLDDSQNGSRSSGERSPAPMSTATISVGAEAAVSNPVGRQGIADTNMPAKATCILKELKFPRSSGETPPAVSAGGIYTAADGMVSGSTSPGLPWASLAQSPELAEMPAAIRVSARPLREPMPQGPVMDLPSERDNSLVQDVPARLLVPIDSSALSPCFFDRLCRALPQEGFGESHRSLALEANSELSKNSEVLDDPAMALPYLAATLGPAELQAIMRETRKHFSWVDEDSDGFIGNIEAVQLCRQMRYRVGGAALPFSSVARFLSRFTFRDDGKMSFDDVLRFRSFVDILMPRGVSYESCEFPLINLVSAPPFYLPEIPQMFTCFGPAALCEGPSGYALTYCRSQPSCVRVSKSRLSVPDDCARGELSRLLRFPAHLNLLAPFMACFEDHGAFYLIQENMLALTVAEGRVLDMVEWMAESNVKSDKVAVWWVAHFSLQLLDAVAHLHAHRILHLGICPAHVLLSGSFEPTPLGLPSQAVLTNAGLGGICHEIDPLYKALGGADCKIEVSWPMGQFAGPEALLGLPSTGSDVFSLGCLLHLLLTGKLPSQTTLIPLVSPDTLLAKGSSPDLAATSCSMRSYQVKQRPTLANARFRIQFVVNEVVARPEPTDALTGNSVDLSRLWRDFGTLELNRQRTFSKFSLAVAALREPAKNLVDAISLLAPISASSVGSLLKAIFSSNTEDDVKLDEHIAEASPVLGAELPRSPPASAQTAGSVALYVAEFVNEVRAFGPASAAACEGQLRMAKSSADGTALEA